MEVARPACNATRDTRFKFNPVKHIGRTTQVKVGCASILEKGKGY